MRQVAPAAGTRLVSHDVTREAPAVRAGRVPAPTVYGPPGAGGRRGRRGRRNARGAVGVVGARGSASYDCWIAPATVFDATPYLPYHPGGEEIIRRCGGRDGTAAFDAAHRYVNGHAMLVACYVGPLVDEDGVPVADAADGDDASSSSSSSSSGS
ncbi:hypothetical protein JL721_12472 [Aureococcus anophagefferens]|nr:hypothetical protein JL721_12472 [Aureococcus anophagefferens]